MRRSAIAAAIAAALVAPAPALAWEAVTDGARFAALTAGRTLTFDGVRVALTPDGRITGRALGLAVTGRWRWEDGHFCRTLRWGLRRWADDCQAVAARPGELRFVADRGAGDVAVMALR